MIGGFASLTMLTKNSFIEEIGKQYVVTARAKGLSEGVVVTRHMLSNALIPIVTVIGLQMGTLIGGSVLVEWIFALPGLGRLFVESVLARDLPVVLGLTLLTGTFTLAGVVGADLAYALADPRVRRGR